MASLSKLTSREAVLEAIVEYDQLGRDAFLEKHGYGNTHTIFVKHNGRFYEQRPIIGVAYGKQHPKDGPLDPTTFVGGKRAGIVRLAPLGFEIVEVKSVLEPTSSRNSRPSRRTADRGARRGHEEAVGTDNTGSRAGSEKKSNAATAENCRRNGEVFERLAASALRLAGFDSVSNLNNDRRRNFQFADILAHEKGVWYAISVKGRNKMTHDGLVKRRYKLDVKKAERALAELRSEGCEAVPAFVAVEVEDENHSIYFGRLNETSRRNGIGMSDHEKALYRCLVENQPHYCSIHKNDGLY